MNFVRFQLGVAADLRTVASKIDRMGVNMDKCEVELAFDGDRITIERPKYSCPISKQ